MPSLDDLKKLKVLNLLKDHKSYEDGCCRKMRKAQENAEKGRPYSQKMQNIILNLTNSINDPKNAPKLLVGTGSDKVYLCVVLTADRGLCGGFNSNICKLAKINFKQILGEGKELKIITAGSKGLDQIKREYGNYVIKKFSFKNKKQITYSEAELIGNEILKLFKNNEFDKCILFYNNFKNVITQIPQAQQIIPADSKSSGNNNEKNNSYEFEPDEDEILEDLLPKNISIQVFRAFLENAASEQGSRMTAMDNATRNAGDLVEKLTINYNRSRQASITKELIEIISGAESL